MWINEQMKFLVQSHASFMDVQSKQKEKNKPFFEIFQFHQLFIKI